jgi:uncharacterized Zn finger protein (UPF0148 family)
MTGISCPICQQRLKILKRSEEEDEEEEEQEEEDL